MRRVRRQAGPALVLGGLLLGGCGSGSSGRTTPATTAPAPPPGTPSRVEIVHPTRAGTPFDAESIYRREASGVVTVTSVFSRGGGQGGGPRGGLGSGFVISAGGEVATNAHVVTNGTGSTITQAPEVYVAFADGNEVPAHVVGYDPFSDVALLRVDPRGLTLRPLPLGRSAGAVVGAPVAAIGSPFGEAQSLSVGVISATGRSIDSLTGFQISGALQTDAPINHGNSGGPLVDATGAVLGINSQIASSGGGGEGVGFAVPIDTARRSLDQLRRAGHVRYAYLGVSTTTVFPQLARRLRLGVDHGAFLQSVVPGGPAARAGLRGGGPALYFQAQEYRTGGDIISAVDGSPVHRDTDLSTLLAPRVPGDRVTLEVWRGGSRRRLAVTLGDRPANTSPQPSFP